MTDTQPSPPPELPAALADRLGDYSAGVLRSVARHAEDLAEYKERENRPEEGDGERSETRPDDLPEGVPSKATLTIKEINDNRYYYWQWRDGETIRSKYKGPANRDS